jgi:hypothetical protein
MITATEEQKLIAKDAMIAKRRKLCGPARDPLILA